MPDDVYDFELAVSAYGLFTLAEKRRALEIMATLRYPSVTDRFFEGVHRAIAEHDERQYPAVSRPTEEARD